MAKVFSKYSEFRRETVTCPKCSWSGPGSKTNVGKMSEETATTEYHCPKCEEHLATTPWPRLKDIRG